MILFLPKRNSLHRDVVYSIVTFTFNVNHRFVIYAEAFISSVKEIYVINNCQYT